ncbi:MAG: hypothetical protein KTR26_08230 [Flammeovirgaceae bacterium]|nr:hypothetical protein [Flammeovirgaceae bacterium]
MYQITRNFPIKNYWITQEKQLVFLLNELFSTPLYKGVQILSVDDVLESETEGTLPEIYVKGPMIFGYKISALEIEDVLLSSFGNKRMWDNWN